ncbi:hypothetical protein LTR85_007397 [Meristemomyces frigidus]|nr:hypothetical protein LTR85_007397 [Meristemomyces frigidus]
MASLQHDPVPSGPDGASDGYPRPDFQRADLCWQSLNGPWDVVFDDEDTGLEDLWQHLGLPIAKRTIEVPYVFQCPASGINERGVHEVLWYERTIIDIRTSEDKERAHRLLVRFGAVDYQANVWLNGHFIGEHRGGHVPFSLGLSEAVRLRSSQDEYRLTVRVYDSAYDLTQPRGKQYWAPQPESIFYTPSSGIWQTVWLESVPSLRLADSSHGTVLRSNDVERGVLDCRIAVQGRRAQQKCSVEIEASFYGISVSKSERRELSREEDFVRFDHSMRLDEPRLQQLPNDLLHDAPLNDPFCWRDGVALWSPEHPALYDLTLRLFDAAGTLVDEVRTTTGMRSLSWTTGDGTFRLNGRPYFQALLLDQGYWPETLMTPPSQRALKQDIVLSKAMGFNGCRKHQKVEDPMFILGFLVWGEMAACYNFSLDAVDRFNQEWVEMVKRDINHPCIVTWTPVNESWGYPDLGGQTRQRDHIRSLYYMTKTLDLSRPINDNCGWEHVITDLSNFTTTLTPAVDEGSKHLRGAPVMCTEFGGVNVALRNDDSRKGNWGYTTASDSQDLLRRVDDLIMATVKGGHVCGIVWTQLSDIEQEMNGLYTYDRREKVPAQQIKAVLEKARKHYYGGLQRHGGFTRS